MIEFQLILQVSNWVVSPVWKAIATSEKSFNQECLWQKIRLKFLRLARSDFEPPSYFVICSNLAEDLTRASG